MAQITRAEAAALISEQDMGELWQDTAKQSLAMQTFRRIQMTKKQAKVRVLDALPAAPGGGDGAGRRGRGVDVGGRPRPVSAPPRPGSREHPGVRSAKWAP